MFTSVSSDEDDVKPSAEEPETVKTKRRRSRQGSSNVKRARLNKAAGECRLLEVVYRILDSDLIRRVFILQPLPLSTATAKMILLSLQKRFVVSHHPVITRRDHGNSRQPCSLRHQIDLDGLFCIKHERFALVFSSCGH